MLENVLQTNSVEKSTSRHHSVAFIKPLLALSLNPATRTRERNDTHKINNENSQSHSLVRLPISTTVSSCIKSTNFDCNNNQMDIDQAYDNQTESKHCGVKT